MPSPTPPLEDSRLEIAGRVARLTLDRDDVRNELTGTSLAQEIATVARWVNAQPEISVFVLTGSGKSFSAGGNVKNMRDQTGEFAGDAYALQESYRRGIQQMSLAMHALEVPAIAQINGAAVGAGFDLTCMCDLRLAAAGAKLGETFVNLGLIPGDGGAWFLQRLVGVQQAALLTFTGRLIDAEQAHALGLILDVVAPEALPGAVDALAAEIAAKPPQALRLAKRLMRSAQKLDLPELLDLSALAQGAAQRLPEHLEAVNAMLEKRPPRF